MPWPGKSPVVRFSGISTHFPEIRESMPLLRESPAVPEISD